MGAAIHSPPGNREGGSAPEGHRPLPRRRSRSRSSPTISTCQLRMPGISLSSSMDEGASRAMYEHLRGVEYRLMDPTGRGAADLWRMPGARG